MRKRQYFLTFIGLSLIVTILAIGIRVGWAANNAKPMVGYLAPNFILQDMNGEEVELKNIIALHKVTLVNFWATWCPPCREEIPELAKFYQENSGQGVIILAVNLQEELKTIQGFAKNADIKFPVLADTTGQVGDLYQIYAIPTTFIINQKGKITHIIRGSTNLDTLEGNVLPLLKGK